MFSHADKLRAEIAALQKRQRLGAVLCLAAPICAFFRQYLGIMEYNNFSGPVFWIAVGGSLLTGLYLILSALDPMREKQHELNRMFVSPGQLR